MEASNSVSVEHGHGYMHLANTRLKFGRPRKEWFISDIDYIWSKIRPDSTVLDYGCGNGSINFLGTDHHEMIRIEGMDELDKTNQCALYHYRNEITRKYDLVIARHVVEHKDYETGELRDFLEWCGSITNRLVTVSPVPSRYYDFWQDPTHKQPCNNEFYLALCEDSGWTIKDVVLSDIRLGSKVFFVPRLAVSAFEGIAPLFSHIVYMER